MSEIDKRIQDAIEKFNPTKMVFNLPKGLVLRVWENQKLQGNTPTSDIFLASDRGEGNFNWSQSKEGQNFWELIHSNNWFGAEVLRIMGSKEAFFEAPDQSQTSDQASERIKELTQDEIQEYFDTDGKSALPSTKRLATGIDSKYAGYLVLGQFGYRIELVSKEDNKLVYSGPWKSYKPKSLINEFLRLNSSALTQMMKDDTPLFDAFNNVISVLRSKYEPESDIRQQEEPIVKTVQEEWRFKTLDEIDEEDLGYSGLEKRTILRYTGKLLTELDLGYPIDVTIKQIKNGQSISVDGYIQSHCQHNKQKVIHFLLKQYLQNYLLGLFLKAIKEIENRQHSQLENCLEHIILTLKEKKNYLICSLKAMMVIGGNFKKLEALGYGVKHQKNL
jgi:hypothetical protein